MNTFAPSLPIVARSSAETVARAFGALLGVPVRLSVVTLGAEASEWTVAISSDLDGFSYELDSVRGYLRAAALVAAQVGPVKLVQAQDGAGTILAVTDEATWKIDYLDGLLFPVVSA